MLITAELVRRLVDDQFPQWSALPISPVQVSGWDNRTFRLGAELSVRLPSAARYVPAVAKEQRWLPRLAAQLPLPIPTPVAQGEPAEGYPFPWTVQRWLDGQNARLDTIGDLTVFAADVADFLVALRAVDATDGPGPGPHNFHRGGPLQYYAEETERSLGRLADADPTMIDVDAAHRVWEAATSTAWSRDPVWFHGDVATGNLLVHDGRLSAVIDFGTSGVGDPACDAVLAWNLLDDRSRVAFRRRLELDDATWARGRGWALWKALITLVDRLDGGDLSGAYDARGVVDRVLADHAEG